jgi:MFS family permease
MAKRGKGSFNGGDRLGPIGLGPGVTTGNAVSFVVVAVVSLGLLLFLNFMQPYVFYGQVAVPAHGMGQITSRLSVMQEVVVLVCVGPFGALSDRIERRIVFAAGLVTVGIALALYSVATTIAGLTGARLLYAIGAAATTATLATVAADYPDESARGKFLGLLLVTQQLAILCLVANGAARLPHWLVAHGMDRVVAGQVTFRAAAVVALLSAGLACFGLRRGAVAARPRRSGTLARFADAAIQVVAHARAQPRFMIVLFIAFVARGDAAIMTGFLSLWAMKTATLGGLNLADALAKAGALLTVVTVCGIASACAVGWLADRTERLMLLTFGLVLAGGGNIVLAMVHGVDAWAVSAAVGLIAAAETSVIICGQTVLGEQAPAAIRGAAVGAFSVSGSLGVLALLLAGGWLFDRISPQAPFVMIGVVNLVASLAVAAVWLASGQRRMVVLAPKPRFD